MSAMPQSPFVTVAICTYNRSRWLRETLASVTRQDYPAPCWEILVIDNNSRDDTRAVVEEFAAAPKAPRYVFEPRQGLSVARNRACSCVAEACAIVAFLDDDVLLEKDWLRCLVKAFAAGATDRVGAVGGEVVPVFPEGLPRWLERQWEPLNYRTDLGRLENHQLPMGANLAILRDLFQRIGPFRTDLGRHGHQLGGTEDHEFARRLRASGYTIWYNPEAKVYHQIPASRLTFRYAFRQAFDSARSRVIEKTGESGKGLGWLLSRLLAYSLQVVGCLLCSLCLMLVLQFGRGRRWITRAAKGAGYLAEIVLVLRRRLRRTPKS